METPQEMRPKRVAVVGTGMAGLATAHLLHQDPQKRYQVTVIEKVGFISQLTGANHRSPHGGREE